MSDTIYCYGFTSDVGFEQDRNEDYCMVSELSSDVLAVAVADGMGSLASEQLQPAQIACSAAINTLKRLYEINPARMTKHSDGAVAAVKMAMYAANDALGVFRYVDEKKFGGFTATMDVVLFFNRSEIAFAHVGVGRIMLVRLGENSKLTQLTTDHTEAQTLYERNEIEAHERNTHPASRVLTSTLGFGSEFPMQTRFAKLRPQDVILIATKGVNFSVEQSAMLQLVERDPSWESVTKNLTEGVRTVLNWPDNTTVFMLEVPN